MGRRRRERRDDRSLAPVLADAGHRAGRERRRADQPAGVHRLRTDPGAVRGDDRRLRRSARRTRLPGRRRPCHQARLRGPDDRHRLRTAAHRGAVRRLRPRGRRSDSGGHLGRGDQGLLPAREGGHPR
ncbi:hypothetical protein OIE71_31150 [Streptomyces sp. NBC_01725]